MSRAPQQSRFRSQTLRRIESKRRTAESASSNFGHHSAHYPHYKDGERAALTARAATYSKESVPSPAVFGSGFNRFRGARWPDAARNPPFLISMSEIRLDGGSHPARDGTLPRPRSTRVAGNAESTSPDFGAPPGPSCAERFGQRLARTLRPRANTRGVAATPDLEAREPASRPIWLHVMQNGPGKCARSGAATKWPRRNLNLPLAARARVGHIRRNGAVAEWLKAAVC